ncbi:MAG: DUF1573 domain-containing protein [Gemmataceae bacterium]|nr:DUF1573 domain-containing protein [Gemmataceae bacterium]
MRPLLGVSAVALTAGLGLGVYGRYRDAAALPPAPGPRVECPEVVDLGQCVYGTDRDVSFEVRNTGTDDLILSAFRTSCTCTGLAVRSPGYDPDASQVVIRPGEAVALGARYLVRSRYNGSTATRVGFATNDPAAPEVVVTLRATRVLGGLTPLPGACNFGRVPVGAGREQVVHLIDEAVRPRRVISVTSSNPDRVAARFAPGERPADLANPGHYLGTVTVALDTATAGDVHERVVIAYDDGEVRTEEVPVTAAVEAKLTALPATLTLPRRTDDGEVYAATVWFRPGGRLTPGSLTFDLPAGVTAEAGEGGPALIPVRVAVAPPGAGAAGSVVVVARAEIDGEAAEARLTIDLRPRGAP